MTETQDQQEELVETGHTPEDSPEPLTTEEQKEAPPRKSGVHEYDRVLDPDKGNGVINEGDVGQQFVGDNIRFGSYMNVGEYSEEGYITHNTNTGTITRSETTNIYNFYTVQSPPKQDLAEDMQESERADEDPGAQQLPQTPELLRKWFYGLEDFDQCFVQAMAIFDGSTVKEVMNAARRLYSRRAAREADASTRHASTTSWPVNVADPQDMMKRAYVKTLRLEKSQRCQWLDTDAQGNSAFKTRVLSLLIDDARFWRENDFYEQLFVWADNLIDENMGRALQVLGAISWHDQQDLEQLAQSWASTNSDWFRVPSFLLGAYTLDLQEYGEERAHHPQKSPVLSLLHKWSQQALVPRRANAACAAALTYALLGAARPQMAFDGLEHLLKLASQNVAPYEDDKNNVPARLYETIVMAYPFLADMGHLRIVLEYLARQAVQLVYERMRLDRAGMSRKERERYAREQWLRQVRADIILDAFYNLAMESLRRQKKTSWVIYNLNRPLPDLPSLRRSEGREILLAGLLSPSETSWQPQISSLICSLLVSNGKEAAFRLLRQWTELILKDQGPSPDQTRLRYLQFMFNIATTGDDWTRHLQSRNIKVPDIGQLFQRELGRWLQEGQRRSLPLALFAQDALDALSTSKITRP